MAVSYPETPINPDRICSIEDIASENHRAGFHWFSPDTMRFFGTRLNRSLLFKGPGGIFFVTSDFNGFDRRGRGYTVRQFKLDDATIGTVEFDGKGVASLTRSRAARLARQCAASGIPQDTSDKG